MAGHTIKTTIASGTALSAEVDLRQWRLIGVLIPPVWTAADVTFQAAPEVGGVSGTYGEVALDPGSGVGTALQLDGAASGVSALNAPAIVGGAFFKVRSGTVGIPVNQAADRVITIYVLPL